MPYFFIIPGYLGLLFLATMTYLYFKVKLPSSSVSSYILFGSLGSAFGILSLNALLWGLIVFVIKAFPNTSGNLMGAGMVILILIGPFIASAAGILLGILVGCLFRYKRIHPPTAA